MWRGREREKKRAKFWASHPSGPHPSNPHQKQHWEQQNQKQFSACSVLFFRKKNCPFVFLCFFLFPLFVLVLFSFFSCVFLLFSFLFLFDILRFSFIFLCFFCVLSFLKCSKSDFSGSSISVRFLTIFRLEKNFRPDLGGTALRPLFLSFSFFPFFFSVFFCFSFVCLDKSRLACVCAPRGVWVSNDYYLFVKTAR